MSHHLDFPFPARRALMNLGTTIDMDLLRTAFEHVPADPYQRDFRFKSIARVIVDGHHIIRTAPGPLYQSTSTNPVHGGIRRNYTELGPDDLALLAPIILMFAALGRLTAEDEILVQLQRIRANAGDDGKTGLPVVEGFHNDAAALLGLLLVQRRHVVGGCSKIARDRAGTELVYEGVLEAGDFLLLDDREHFHNATPIRAVTGHDDPVRDVVIITTPAARPPEHAGGLWPGYGGS